VYKRVTDRRGGQSCIGAIAIVTASFWAAVGLLGCERGLEPGATGTRERARPWLPHYAAVAGADGAGTAGATADGRAEVLLPARIRRLSSAEYDGSVAALLGGALPDVTHKPSRGFAPDARQGGFTVNEAQRVDAVLAKQLFAAAAQLAAEARGSFTQLAPCAAHELSADSEGCARAFIADFGARAYRRPLSEEESTGLLEVYRAGALAATYDDGVELVIRALLQSAGFLYVTELGPAAPVRDDERTVALTAYELASELAYLMTGGPPDAALLTAAAAGELDSAQARRDQVMRLRREQPATRDQLVHILHEWLELDRIAITAKDSAFYPTYESLQPLFLAESHDFIAAVLDDDSAGASDVSTLLNADWTIGDQLLAAFYDTKGSEEAARIALPTRRGILNQGAFLAVHSHAYESAPVLRGAVIARRLACIPVPAPDTLGISVTAPPADPVLTTRQRFAEHDANPSCAPCHKTIDGFGNAFEQYDGMGGRRLTENSVMVDSTTLIAAGLDFDGAYADSDALAAALATSPVVAECFARNLFRSATARGPDSRSATDTQASEDEFIALWRELPEHERGNVVDTLAVFVTSRLFTHRSLP